jgi:hypothetical protein
VLRRRTKHFPGRLILEIARGAQIARRAAGRPSAAGQNKTSPGAFTIGWHCECLIVSPIADPGKDPECQNPCLLLRCFLPAYLLRWLRAETKGLPRSSRRVRATPPAFAGNNWATTRRFNSACDSTGKN